MRRIPLLLFVFLLLLLVTGCGNPAVQVAGPDKEAKKTPTVSIRANDQLFQDEASLFEDADLIVIAETTTCFTDREHVLSYTERDEAQGDLPPALSGFYTKTPITVWKVLKQPTSDSIQKQEKLEILEPVALIEQEQGVQKVTMENYLEIEPGSKYILYLKANTNGSSKVSNSGFPKKSRT